MFEKIVHASIFPTSQGGANENNMLAKFAAFLEWEHRDIKSYAKNIVLHARTVAEILLGFDIKLTTGGTDCHILLIELADSRYTGADVEASLEKSGVLVNKNLIPGDKRSAAVTSGIRIGTTNLAILEYSLEDTKALAFWIAHHLKGQPQSDEVISHLLAKYHRANAWANEVQ
jgi:glycine hydroxymethyltransferase